MVCFIFVGGNSQFLRGVKKIIPLRNKNLFHRQQKESNYYVQEHDNGKVPQSGKGSGQRPESQIILIEIQITHYQKRNSGTVWNNGSLE